MNEHLDPVPVHALLIEGVDLETGVTVGSTHKERCWEAFWVDLERLKESGEFWYATTLNHPMRQCEVTRGPKVFANGELAVELRQDSKVIMIRLIPTDKAKNWNGVQLGVFAPKSNPENLKRDIPNSNPRKETLQ